MASRRKWNNSWNNPNVYEDLNKTFVVMLNNCNAPILVAPGRYRVQIWHVIAPSSIRYAIGNVRCDTEVWCAVVSPIS